MTREEYIALRNQIIAATKNINVHEDANFIGGFNVVSASLSNYVPSLEYAQHPEIFRGIILNQQLSVLEQSYAASIDHVSYENLDSRIWKLLRQEAAIICTFHTGSYRLINHFLASKKIPYALVASGNVVHEQGSIFQQLYRELTGSNDPLTIINAEMPSSGLQMLRELKRGRHLLLYMDGNTGAGNVTANNGNHCNIHFLNQMIFARRGIGFLAHAAGVPIIEAICYRRTLEDVRIKFFPPIYPAKDVNRQIFADQATQAMYDRLSPIIEQYPEQWEGWLYLHKVAHITNPYQGPASRARTGSCGKLKFNTSLFGIFKIAGNAFLFNKNSYMSFPIEDTLYSQLLNIKHQPVLHEKLGPTLQKQLCDNYVLVSA